MIRLQVGRFEFHGVLETLNAPRTVAWLRARLPLRATALQARWSGDSGWAPLGAVPALEPEHTLHRPAPGQLLLYAGELSEPELLLPYGECAFACCRGPLSGNHVITLHAPDEALRQMGHELLHRGAQALTLTETPEHEG